MYSRAWTSKQKRFLRLLSSGVSLEEIAQELKVGIKRLTKWRSLPGFKEALEGACTELVMEEMPHLLRALTEKAKEGNIQAIKILFDYLGHLQERNKGGTNLGDFNEEERQKVKALLKEIIGAGESAEGETTLKGHTGGGGGEG